MLAQDALAEFRRFLSGRGIELSRVTPRQAVDVMLAFFREIEATDCDPDANGDMLLYQWGTYDWGQGRHFEFDVTRQLIPRGGEDDDIWQLRLTIRFSPKSEFTALGASNRWCQARDDVESFSAFVTESPAFVAVADSLDGQAELVYECAG